MIRLCWWTNLDADFELARGIAYTVSPRMRAHCDRLGRLLVESAQAYAEPGVRHRHLTPGRQPEPDETLLCWSPTPSCLRRFPGRHWPVSTPTLSRVNHRRFGFELGAGPPGARWFDDARSLERWWTNQDTGQVWLLKRGLGFSGRWQKRLSGSLDQSTRRWIEASMDDYGGGLLAEPLMQIEWDCAQHAWLESDGQLHLGSPTISRYNAKGAWLEAVPAADRLCPTEREALRQSCTAVAQALHAADYSGPFGIDSYRYRQPDGRSGFLPLSEINARFTMAFPLGFAGRHHLLGGSAGAPRHAR